MPTRASSYDNPAATLRRTTNGFITLAVFSARVIAFHPFRFGPDYSLSAQEVFTGLSTFFVTGQRSRKYLLSQFRIASGSGRPNRNPEKSEMFCGKILEEIRFLLPLHSQWETIRSCGNSSVGRAQPCQGWGREFESRFPLSESATYRNGVADFLFAYSDKTRLKQPFQGAASPLPLH